MSRIVLWTIALFLIALYASFSISRLEDQLAFADEDVLRCESDLSEAKVVARGYKQELEILSAQAGHSAAAARSAFARTTTDALALSNARMEIEKLRAELASARVVPVMVPAAVVPKKRTAKKRPKSQPREAYVFDWVWPQQQFVKR